MKNRLTFSVVLSLAVCFTIIGILIRQASASPPASSESNAAFRYRTSQVAHWRAITLVHQN